jgi:DNA-binding CsgD family transcriptional regulator
MTEPLGADTLILSLYDAALDPRQWSPIAQRLAQCVHADSAAIQIQAPAEKRVQILSRTQNLETGEKAYRAYYHARDLLIGRAFDKGANQAFVLHDLITDGEWSETEIYRDFFSSRGVYQVLGGTLILPRDELGVIGVHRPHHARPFGEDEKAFLRRVMPHFEHALKVHTRLQEAALKQCSTEEFLSRSTTALLVVDRTGRLLLASPKGEALLERSLALTTISGRVVAAHMSAHHRLARMIESAVDTASGNSPGEAGGTLTLPSESPYPLSVTVAPLRPKRDGAGLQNPAAILFVRDPNESINVTNTAQDMFGLTRSEALLANALINGRTLQQVALAHDVSLNTIRTQLKSVLTKTGTNRQSELVALLLRCISDLI